MAVSEKLGSFYLGQVLNLATGKPEKKEFYYDSKDLTTHAVCVGMTGSGKTGLGITVLEEAGMDHIPAIIIDPKGDLTNLLLTFPDLSPEEFLPWIDESEAAKKGISALEYAKSIAQTWKEGLSSSGENKDRIKTFRDSVDLEIYTPASQLGRPISILNSFSAPPKEEMSDTGAMREKIQSLTSSLLGLLGIAADPIKSREHILISTLILDAWKGGKNLDIATLIQQVQKPPFSKIGALPIDTFYPPKERLELSVSLNNLLASPGFQVWMEGDPLDIQQLLYTSKGKPKFSIISIMHLSDSERMFFVTLLLNEFLSWMRQQSGTSNLRAILYMDEIFGFFPPTAMPPSKLPMLTLLKQARAFGIGIFLVTQNPVDLDYKGLSNCGTWFIGKLQTERDKARVIEGLKIASNGEFDTKALDKALALIRSRTFIMRSIYQQDPVLFQTRWTLSYLRGPLTLTQIAKLTHPSEENHAKKEQSFAVDKKDQMEIKPPLPPNINEFFVIPSQSKSPIRYEPRVMGKAKLHFVNAKYHIDVWKEFCFILKPEEEGSVIPWEKGENQPEIKDLLKDNPPSGSTFDDLPSGLMQPKNYSTFEKAFASALYQNQTYPIYHSTFLNMTSKPGESQDDFHERIVKSMAEKRDAMIKKLRDRYDEKINDIKTKINRLEKKMSEKKQKAGLQLIQTLISFFTTILDALLGRKLTRGTITQTGTTLRRAGQTGKDNQDAKEAEADVNKFQQQLKDLESERDREILSLTQEEGNESLKFEKILIRPRKSDIDVEKIALVWWPKDSPLG